MTDVQLRQLARSGALLRLEEVITEIGMIYRAFPDLPKRLTITSTNGTQPPRFAATRNGHRRRKMSAANRKAVSVRMKKYWAGRRKREAART